MGLAGFGGKADSQSLDAALKRATHSEKVDVAKDDLLAIAQSSHHEDDRRKIMRHLALCLNDSGSSKWRCVHSALVVVEYLVHHGSEQLIPETDAGFHFDVAQRLSLLAKFEYCTDKRVEAMVRRRASSLRVLWLERQEQQVIQSRKNAKKEARGFPHRRHR